MDSALGTPPWNAPNRTGTAPEPPRIGANQVPKSHTHMVHFWPPKMSITIHSWINFRVQQKPNPHSPLWPSKNVNNKWFCSINLRAFSGRGSPKAESTWSTFDLRKCQEHFFDNWMNKLINWLISIPRQPKPGLGRFGAVRCGSGRFWGGVSRKPNPHGLPLTSQNVNNKKLII